VVLILTISIPADYEGERKEDETQKANEARCIKEKAIEFLKNKVATFLGHQNEPTPREWFDFQNRHLVWAKQHFPQFLNARKIVVHEFGDMEKLRHDLAKAKEKAITLKKKKDEMKKAVRMKKVAGEKMKKGEGKY